MWGYVDGLEKATSDLAADGDRLSKLQVEDPRRVRWDKFIDWYTQQFSWEINAELQRIRIPKDKMQSLRPRRHQVISIQEPSPLGFSFWRRFSCSCSELN